MPSELDRALQQYFGRRDFLRYAGIVAGAGVLAACHKATSTATGGSSTPSARPPIGSESGKMEIFDWPGYGDGAYGDQVLWKSYKTEFPTSKLHYTAFDDDTGYTNVSQGLTYDIAHPCGYKFPDWVALNILQPWDTSLLTNFPDLNPNLEKAGVFNGKQYFIVADWGFAAPMYRTDKVHPTEDSWSLLWDERYKGKITWWDSLDMLPTAGYANGIPDPYNMTDAEIEQMKQFLIDKKKAVEPLLWTGQTDVDQQMKQEEAWVAYAWPASWVVGEGNGLKLTYMQPKEGRTSWYCGFALFGSTKNYYHAHKYVDAWMSPASGAWLLTNYAYGHTNTKVDLSKVPAATVKAFSLDDPTILQEPKTHIERPIPNRAAYSAAWDEVKSA